MPSPRVDNAADELRATIAAAGGAIPFSEFQRIALYGSAGFYIRPGGGRAGRREGSFLTSPEVGPLFGAVLARYLDAQWNALDRPARFTIVDAGAGPGTLARSIIAARPACATAMRYVAVEVSDSQRAQHPADVESLQELPDGPLDGVIANELLDNLPFRLCVFDGAWREAFVVAHADGTFGEMLSAPFDPRPAVLPPAPAHGSRAPLHTEAVTWLADARSRLTATGWLLAIDYAAASTASLVRRPWREWLRTYRDHGRGNHYLADPGRQDITVEIALDQFPQPIAVSSQGEFLRRWGIDDLVADGQRVWAANAAAPDLRAIAMRSRPVEAGALLDPHGLGRFNVLEWSTPP